MDYVRDLKTSFFGSEKVGTIEFSQPTLYGEEQTKDSVHLSVLNRC
jgi:hypothetical protein